MPQRTTLFRQLLPIRTALILLGALAPAASLALPVEGVTPVNSRDYTPAVRRVIQNARKSLLVQLYQARFYAEYPDTGSNRFLEDLIAAAKRGVDVKVVIDTGDWNPSQKNEYNLDFVDRLTTAGVHVWEDAPSDVSHQKVITADDDITVVASLNWTYYSLAKNNEVAAVIRSKPLNAWFRRYFYERAASGHPRANAKAISREEIPALVPDFPGESTEKAPRAAAAASGSPRDGELAAADVEPIPNRLYYPALHEALLGARSSVDVVQRSIKLSPAPPAREGGPLPGEPSGAVDVLVEDLIAAARRGVKVRVILDYTEKMDDPDNAEAAAYLRAHGVDVFEEDPKSQTHAKMLIIDGQKVVLGSTNWTRPSVEQGNEASVMINSAPVAAVYKRFVDDLISKGGVYRQTSSSIWKAPAKGQETANPD